MTKTKFVVTFSILWVLTYVSVIIKIASISSGLSTDKVFSLLYLIYALLYIPMSTVAYKWGKVCGKSWLLIFPVLAGIFEFINIPVLPSILCLITLVLGAISNASNDLLVMKEEGDRIS